MSYILEALRKMERQTRKDSQSESWVDDLSVESEGERAAVRGPNRLLMAASIFFGVSGIITGLLLYEGKQAVEKNQNPIIQSKPVVNSPKSAPPKVTEYPNKVSGSVSKASVKGVTLAELNAKLSAKSKKADKENPSAENLERGKSVPPPPPQIPKSKTMIDLTNSYRLTSTGAMNNRKYATIERKDYYIGDEFMDMVITDIKRDRVHLKRKRNDQTYVIIFRYKRH